MPEHLVVYNDDVNTFDHVIDSLIDICNHSEEQAEQCAMIVHFKGKWFMYYGTADSFVGLAISSQKNKK